LYWIPTSFIRVLVAFPFDPRMKVRSALSIVTDRVVLDRQLQRTVGQFAQTAGAFRCSYDRADLSGDMAAFDDSTDPELGAACNRLATWVEPLPAGALIDDQSGLTEQDLALILRHLHATRLDGASDTSDADEAPRPSSRPSVPITARD